MKLLCSLLTEYGLAWMVNRSLYSCKLKMLKAIPQTERFFEKTISIKRLDLFNFDIVALQTFLKNLNDADKEKIIKQADQAMQGEIIGFSGVLLDYGSPINWQLNPLTGVSFDKSKKWYSIPDFDSERGDIKAVWEASRFTHFLLFARAYLLTENKKYYGAFALQLNSWLKDNPYSFGANYKCGQECALRLVNTLITFGIFSKCGCVDSNLINDVTELVSRCYKKILSNFFYAYRCIKNNHTLAELAGTIAGAWCCQDEKLLKRAYWLYDKVVIEQFTDDGGYCQFSFNYQRLAMQLFECVCKMSERTGYQLNEVSRKRLYSAALLMYQCQTDTGDLPNYGSNDGALIFPVTSCGYRDFSPVINTTSMLAHGCRLFKNGIWDEELLWFGTLNGPLETIEKRSVAFPKAGLFTLRNRHIFVMVVLNDYKTRPSHMDQLHSDLWIDGTNVLCDSGTYSYASDSGKKMASTQGHNTIIVGRRQQMMQYGSFMIYGWTKRKAYIHTGSTFEGVYLSCNGYQHRRIIRLYENSIEILDEVLGAREFVSLVHTPLQVRNGVLRQKELELAKIDTESKMEISPSRRSLFYLQSELTTEIAIHSINGKSKYEIRLEQQNNG